MKNLLQHTDSFEKLEELPSRSKIRLGNDGWGRYKGRNYPHKKVHRFLECRIGVKWDDVFSEFVHLTWIKDEDKTRENLSRTVVFNTLMKDGKVHYLEEGSGDVIPITDYRWRTEWFYIHPITKRLDVIKCQKEKKEKKPEVFRVIGAYHQLIKLRGIWHEVKGVPVKPESDIVVIDNLHYRKVKILPVEDNVQPRQPHDKFFGRKVVFIPPKYKKTDDGFYLIPTTASAPYWNYRNNDAQNIGPKDQMIVEYTGTNDHWERYTHKEKNRNSIKITSNRQLSSKELKRHGIKNDFIPPFKKACPICGSVDPFVKGNCYHHK